VIKSATSKYAFESLARFRLKRILILVLSGLMFNSQAYGTINKELPNKKFQLLSQAFCNGEEIPSRYSCTREGQNISPPLNWVNPPKGTKSFALIMVDPDIPLGFTFTHWLIYDIPAERKGLVESVPHKESFADGMVQGKNLYRKNEYSGPHPVWGRHRYFFTIYALNIVINPDSNFNKKRLMQAMKGHILDQAELMGYYSKR
jgi:Raf kinase inhibitor-like YbhB/YbcL family protein